MPEIKHLTKLLNLIEDDIPELYAEIEKRTPNTNTDAELSALIEIIEENIEEKRCVLCTGTTNVSSYKLCQRCAEEYGIRD